MGHHARGTITARHYSRYSFECEKREALDAWASRLEEILGTSGSYRSRLAPESSHGPNHGVCVGEPGKIAAITGGFRLLRCLTIRSFKQNKSVVSDGEIGRRDRVHADLARWWKSM